jgi:hypothetical protein
MAWFDNIGAALASKGAAALGASVLMVGGGVAVAQSGVGLDTAEDHLPEEVGVGLDTARDHVPDHVDLDELFPFAGQDEAGSGVIEVEPGVVEVQEIDVQEIVDLDIAANGEGERSETADRVHRALTGAEEGAEDPIGPGDEGFGGAVSARAQEEGPLGEDVSSAARGDDEEEVVEGGDDSPGASSTAPGPPEEVPGPPTNPGPNG